MLRRLQSEDFHSYIEYYQKNQDRIELLHKEIASWEYEFGGVKAVQTDREMNHTVQSGGLTLIQREAMFRIEQCYIDITECQRKMKVVDDLLDYLWEVGDETEHSIIKLRSQRKRWEEIGEVVNYSFNNCRYLYFKAISRYINFIRQLS